MLHPIVESDGENEEQVLDTEQGGKQYAYDGKDRTGQNSLCK